MQFIDTHTHLFVEQFDEDRAEAVQRAIDSGISKFFLPHIDSETTDAFYGLCEQFPNHMFPLMGVHPSSIKTDYIKELDHVFKQYELVSSRIPQQKFYGVGEIGIDLYWDKSHLKEQQDAFTHQLLFAKAQGLPIIIHARDSFKEIFEIVEKHNDDQLTGIFHCFTGGIEEAERIIGFGGFKMGLGGVLTFKKSGLDKTVEQIDLNHFVLETDAPYLAPTPFRGKRNESSYLIKIAEKLAEIKELSLEEVAKVTTQNAKHVFGV